MRKIKFDFRHTFYDLMYQEQYEEANKELRSYLKKNKKSFQWFMLKCKNVDDISFLFERENCHSFDVFGFDKVNRKKIEEVLKELGENCSNEHVHSMIAGSLSLLKEKRQNRDTFLKLLGLVTVGGLIVWGCNTFFQ